MWIHVSSPQLASSSSILKTNYNHEDNGGDSGAKLREWSSIIGIVTAIVGNILISFALNTQRYAHIRIDREYNQTRKTVEIGGKGLFERRRTYGTDTQEAVAEERSQLNATAPGPGASPRVFHRKTSRDPRSDEGEGMDETQPLHASFQSECTLSSSEKEGSNDIDERRSYLTSGYWWLGIVMMTVGEAGNFLAYGFAPASIVSPLGVVALVSNCVIAPFMLKERFRGRDLWGVLVAIGGAVTVVLSAKNSEHKMGPDDLWDAILRWEFLLYLGITTIVIISLMFASPRYGGRTILVDVGLVGLFGGYTALSTKGVASLLSDTLWRALTFPIMYLLIVVLICSALMQIRYINKALQLFDSTQVIPTQFVLFTISVIIGSAVLYRDFESTPTGRAAEFIGGCLLTFFGVYLITSNRPNRGDDRESGKSVEEEDGVHLIDDEADQEIERTPMKESILNTSTRDGLLTSTSHGAENSSSLSVSPTSPSPASASTPRILIGHGSWTAPSEQLDDTQERSDFDSPTQSNRATLYRSQTDRPQTPSYGSPELSRYPSKARTLLASSRANLSNVLLRTPSGPAAPQTPLRANRANSPPRADPTVHLGPSPSSAARSSRGSISRLLPGPLLSPLSSSLSAVVADSILRGEGTSQNHRLALARSRSTRLQGRQQSATPENELARQRPRGAEPFADVDVNITGVHEGAEPADQKTSRFRGVSDTLGGLFGVGIRGRQKNEEHDACD